MNAQELINTLKAQDITLHWDGVNLKWRASFEYSPPSEIIDLIRENRDEIIKRIDGPVPDWLLSETNIVKLTQGDCLGAMGRFQTNLVDLIVTDPPYGYKFMGKDWDKAVPSVEIWKECLRVLKPGGFAFIMSAPRQDVLARMIVNLEEAGFRTGFTSLYWTYASGFPKALNISKSIEKRKNAKSKKLEGSYAGYQPKPAIEVILIAQKPLTERTYVNQALSNKKGITWLDDCRIPYENEPVWSADGGVQWSPEKKWNQVTRRSGNDAGRFPANLLVSDEVLDDGKTYGTGSWTNYSDGPVFYEGNKAEYKEWKKISEKPGKYSRFFSLDAWAERNLPFLIVPKASKKEKNFGCDNLTPQQVDKSRKDPDAISCKNHRNRGEKHRKNYHPTVKPALLMSYLITMGSREGELVLDPFCGSGTTCMAARLLKRPSIGIEKDSDYFNIATARMRALTLATWGEETKKDTQHDAEKKALKATTPLKKTKKVVIYHDKPGIALTPQKKIDSHNFPFTLNTIIGCHFGCRYCYLQGYPFNRHAKFSKEAKVKLWIAERLDKDLTKYKHLPQHLKRVQVNVATEGYLPTVMAKVKKKLNRDIMAEVLQVFRKHWETGNHWMVHLITKSHMVLKHLDIISAMKDQVQLEMTITALDEERRRQMEGCAPSVQKRLKVMRELATAGVFVRAMCMPLIGTRQEAEAIKDACFDHGARAFKHKGVNYWDECALLNGETKRESGRQDEVFEDLLEMSCEPYRINGEIQKMTVKMPVIVKSGKSKRWKGYKETDFQDREMIMEVSGYSEINDIEWGYVT